MDLISTGAHVLGFLGMVCVVIAFNQTVSGKWDSQGTRFNTVNLIGAICLLLSLLIHFNLGSFVIEIFWIAISLKGLMRSKPELAHASDTAERD